MAELAETVDAFGEPLEEVRLSREMKVFSVSMIGVGAMIGAGIFVLTGIAAGVAGPGLILAFGLNGIVTLFTAMAYAELGSSFPDAGGGYLWVKEGLPHPNGFLSGWMSWFAHAVACSLYALGFGAYFGHVLESMGLSWGSLGFLSVEKVLAVLACILFAYINFRGASETGKAGNIVTLAKVAVIGIFIAFGLSVLAGKIGWQENFKPFLPKGIGGVATAMGLTFIAFQGYEVIAQCSEEVENPKKNIPRAIFLSLAIVIPIYLLVALAALGAVDGGGIPTWQYLGLKKEIAMVEAARQFLPGGAIILLVGGLLSTLSALNATIYSSSRVSFAMGRDHNLPDFFGQVHSRTKTPYLSIIASIAIVIFMAVALPIEDVASAADIMFLLLFLQVNVTLIRLRKKRPDLDRGFRVPLFPLIPVLGIGTQLFIAVYMVKYSPKAWIATATWIAIGFAVYHAYASKKEEVALRVKALREAEVRRKDYRILVPLGERSPVRGLMTIASALAKEYDGEIMAMSVIELPPAAPLIKDLPEVTERRTILRQAESIARKSGVVCHRIIKVTHRISFGILETAQEERSNFVLMGRTRKGGVLPRLQEAIIYSVLEKAPCNVAILKGNGLEKIRRILLPIDERPNTKLAANLAPGIANGLGAEVVFLKVLPFHASPGEEERAQKIMEELTRDLPFNRSPRLEIVKSTAISAGILEMSRDVDLILMGAPRTGRGLGLLIYRSPVDEIIELSEKAVMVVKRHESKKHRWFETIRRKGGSR